MRKGQLLVILFFLFSLHVAFGQNKLITLNLKNSNYATAIKKIEEQTGYTFLINESEMDTSKPVTIIAKNRPLDEVLKEVLAPFNLIYLVRENHIILKKETTPKTASPKIKIEGVVLDETESPLIGANVSVEGTTNGTLTDMDGKFSLNVNTGDNLKITYVGYLSQKITVIESRTNYIITLREDSKLLDEVVVVGFGTQRKVNLSGAVATIDSKAIESRPINNAAQALQGMAAGLNVSQSGGGSYENKSSLNVRGMETIGDGSQGGPLVLIDGTWGDINTLNPQDIDNISILKDAAASSIYGSRAPFGVILVTTKKGKEGKMTVNYNNNFRWTDPILMPNPMDSHTFALYTRDTDFNEGNTPWITDEWLQRIIDYQAGKIATTTIPNAGNPLIWEGGYAGGNDNVNKYKLIYDSWVFSQEHNISVNGGNDKINYYVSGQFSDQNGLIRYNRDKMTRYTTTAKIGAKLSNILSLNYSGRFVREDYGRPAALTNSWLNESLGYQSWSLLPLYDNNGYVIWSRMVDLTDRGRDKSQNDTYTQQLQVVLEPIKSWKTFGEINYRIRNDFRHWELFQTYRHNVAGELFLMSRDSEIYEEGFRANYFNPNVYSEYSKSLSGGHNFKGMVGFQAELNKYRKFSALKKGIIDNDITVLNMTSGLDPDGKLVSPTVSGEYENWSTAGFFGRINYDYKGRYLFEGNLRYDGTSRFRDDLRWQYLPSFSVAWNIAQEDFFSKFENIDLLKVRFSYGVLGNQNTGNWYPTYETMKLSSANNTWLINGQKANSASAPGLISTLLSWEKIRTWNIGLDLTAFSNRLSSSLDIYTRYTDDMVGPARDLSVILGTNVPKMNNTDLRTYGFEFEIMWRDRLKNGLNYDVKFMLWDSQTKITRYPNENGLLTTYRKGQKTGEIWGYETIGIAKTDEEMQAHLATLPNGGQNALGSQWEAGDIMFKDLNNDGKIDRGANTINDHGDYKIIGNNTPRFSFGLNIGADWKGFDFRAFFQGIMKRDYFQSNYYFWGGGSSIWQTVGWVEHGDYFRNNPDHPLGLNINSYYPRPLYSAKNRQAQTKYVQDASYIRLKNLQFGYSLPVHITQKAGMNKLRIFVSGENLWTGTKMSSVFDPETITGGWGGNVYPLSKVISFGLSINL